MRVWMQQLRESGVTDMKIIEARYCTINKQLSGELMVSKKPLSFLGGINYVTGKIIDPHHDLYGQCMEGKIFVYPFGKGSTGDCIRLWAAHVYHKAPVAIINVDPDAIQLEGALLAEIPVLFGFEEDIYEHLKTGNRVSIDGNKIIIAEQ